MVHDSIVLADLGLSGASKACSPPRRAEGRVGKVSNAPLPSTGPTQEEPEERYLCSD